MDLFLNLIPSGIESNLISLKEMSSLENSEKINNYIMLATRLNNIKDKNPTIITWLSKGTDPSSLTGKLKEWGISPDDICTSSQAKSVDKNGEIQKKLFSMLFQKAKELVDGRTKDNGVKNYGDAGMIFEMLLNKDALLKMDMGMKKNICHYLLKHHQFSRNTGLGELIKPLMKEIGFDRQQLDSFIKSNAYQLARNVSETVDSARKMVNNLSRKR